MGAQMGWEGLCPHWGRRWTGKGWARGFSWSGHPDEDTEILLRIGGHPDEDTCVLLRIGVRRGQLLDMVMWRMEG